MVTCMNVTKEYYSGTPFLAVNNATLHVEKGEFVALTGKSGSGKSTLLNMMGLIDAPTSGTIKIAGTNVGVLSSNQRALFRNKMIGYIFQAFYLENSYSVYKNVEIPLLISNMKTMRRKQRVEDCLKQVDMLHRIDSKTCELSGGEKQRICIARAIANSPKLILADEPCGNLDSENTEHIMRLLRSLNQGGTTVIMVTHSNDEARQADRIIKLKDGVISNDEM